MELFKALLVLIFNVMHLVALCIFVGIQAKSLWSETFRKRV